MFEVLICKLVTGVVIAKEKQMNDFIEAVIIVNALWMKTVFVRETERCDCIGFIFGPTTSFSEWDYPSYNT